MAERVFVLVSRRELGRPWWIVGELRSPRSLKVVNIWTFRTKREALRLIEAHGRLVDRPTP